MSKTFESGQLLIIIVTAFGTLLAQAGLEWIKNFLQARDRRKESSDAVVIKQIDINAEATGHLHEWWQEQVQKNQQLFEEKVKAESQAHLLELKNAELEKENRELKTRTNLIEWIEHELKEHPEALKTLLEQITKPEENSEEKSQE